MEEIALFLGKIDDASEYRKFADGTRKAYQALVQTKGYLLDTDRQARLVRPLAFNLLNMEQTRFAKKRLLTALEHYGWRVGTGFLSTPLILGVLSKIDLESAYKLLENEEMPGWLYMTKSGANTVWESWEGTTAQHGIASLNHYSKSACCEWIFRSMCGVQVAGENQFLIEPKPGGSFTYARFSYDSVYGTVKSSWERKDEDTVIHVSIPANTTAAIKLPDGRMFTVTCGEHQWTSK
jgi:alpha-L-rhamnosidase